MANLLLVTLLVAILLLLYWWLFYCYFIGGYFIVILLVVISHSFINGYWWLLVYILYIKATVSVCVGSAWKILLVTARSPEITHLNTLNRAFLTVSVFGHLEFAYTGGVHQNLDMEFLRT